MRYPITDEGLEHLAMRIKLEEEFEEMWRDEEDIRESWNDADRQREADEVNAQKAE